MKRFICLIALLFVCSCTTMDNDKREYQLMEKAFLRFVDYNRKTKESVDFNLEVFDEKNVKIGDCSIRY